MSTNHPDSTPPRPLRILMVAIRFPEVEGGVDAMVHELIAALGPRAEVDVFVPGTWDDRRLTTSRHGTVTRHSLRLRMPFDRARPLTGFIGWLGEFPGTLRALVRLLRDRRYDIVHLHTVTNHAAYFLLAGRLAGVPCVITLHGSDVTAFDRRGADERWMIRRALAGAAAIVAVSGALAMMARTVFALAGTPAVIRNGIDVQGVEATGAAGAGGAAAEAPFVLSAGALDHVKGHDVLIRAWADVAAEFPDVRLVLAGDGDRAHALRGLARELGCAGSIEFRGALPRREVLQLMRRARLFVLPSRSEGLPLALVEAGAVGCPVVATAVGGIGEIVVNDDCGRLVPPEDPPALAAALRELLAGEALRARLAAALQAHVRERFSSAAMAEGYLRVYRDAAGKRL